MENQMTVIEKHLVIALTVSAVLVLFNIAAVTSGSADVYYAGVEELLLGDISGR